MTRLRTILVACAIAATASFAAGATTAAASQEKPDIARASELSAAKRTHPHPTHPHHHANRYHVPRYQAPHYSTYGRGNDPSLGPDGRPYRVPSYLRNQCYIDDGYGRFSACPNY